MKDEKKLDAEEEFTFPKAISFLESRDLKLVKEAKQWLLEKKDESLPFLIEALNSPSEEVRTYACELLGKLNIKEASPHLESLFLKEPIEEVRIAAIEALKNIKNPSSIKVFEKALLEDREEWVRWIAAEALGEFSLPEVVPTLISALEDEHEKVVYNAVTALGKIATPEAIKALVGALRHPDWDVRHNARGTLIEIGEKAIDPLINILKDKESFMREYAISILGDIGNTRAAAPICELLWNEPDEWVRWRCIEALAIFKQPESIKVLIRSLTDISPRVRESAVIALSVFKDERILPALMRAYNYENDPEIATRIKEVINKLGGRV